MILTLRELADYLRINERTILRMLKDGRVQGAKIGGQWRFNSSQIDGLFFGDDSQGDNTLVQSSHSPVRIPLSRIVTEKRIILDMKATTAEEAISELVNFENLNSLMLESSTLVEKCLAREKLLSTGIGQGIAIPHPRDPMPSMRASAVLIFGRSPQGIAYNAVDNKPVDLFLLLCSQNIEIHLHLMGRLSVLLRDKDFVNAARVAKTEEEIMRLILESERKNFLHA